MAGSGEAHSVVWRHACSPAPPHRCLCRKKARAHRQLVSVVAVGTLAERLHAVLDLVGAVAAFHEHGKLEEDV